MLTNIQKIDLGFNIAGNFFTVIIPLISVAIYFWKRKAIHSIAANLSRNIQAVSNYQLTYMIDDALRLIENNKYTDSMSKINSIIGVLNVNKSYINDLKELVLTLQKYTKEIIKDKQTFKDNKDELIQVLSEIKHLVTMVQIDNLI